MNNDQLRVILIGIKEHADQMDRTLRALIRAHAPDVTLEHLEFNVKYKLDEALYNSISAYTRMLEQQIRELSRGH